MERKTLDKISNILLYVGLIGASVMAVGYIMVLIILIKGFDQHLALRQNIIFSVVTSVIGLIIMTFLKIQGESWAASIPENKQVVDEYKSPKIKEAKLTNMTHYWIWSSIRDVIFKVGSVATSTIGIIYVIITGSNDWKLLLLGVFNLALFACFGMLACAKTYDYYNGTYIPYLKKKIYEAKIKADMELVKAEHNQQRDADMVSHSESNILESSDSGISNVLSIQDENRDNDSIDMVSIDDTAIADTSNPSNISNSLRA